MKYLVAILISLSLPIVAWSLLAESSPNIPDRETPASHLGPKSVTAEGNDSALKPVQQQDLRVVSSGQGISQTGLAQPEISSGPVYSKIPELTPQQARELQRETEEEEPTVPVPQGRVWTQIPRPSDPPTAPISGESDSRKLFILNAPQATNDFRYQQTTDLPSNGSPSLSEVNEPSVANMGSTVVFTGNWYAARSTNGGQTFTYVSPSTTFTSVNGGFCCDQVVNYVPSQDMMLWELQYLSDGTSNTIRIARAVGSAAVANNSWISYKFTPQDFGFPTGTYLDFPNLTFGSTFVYLTENVFVSGGSDQDSRGSFTGSVIMRIRLSDLAAGGSISYSYYAQSRSSSDVANLRCTEGAGATIYCGGWRTTSQLRIFHWDDGASSIFLTTSTPRLLPTSIGGTASLPALTERTSRLEQTVGFSELGWRMASLVSCGLPSKTQPSHTLTLSSGDSINRLALEPAKTLFGIQAMPGYIRLPPRTVPAILRA